jgi:hypothetical protein
MNYSSRETSRGYSLYMPERHEKVFEPAGLTAFTAHRPAGLSSNSLIVFCTFFNIFRIFACSLNNALFFGSLAIISVSSLHDASTTPL